MQSLLKFCILTTLLAHWLACLWGFISSKGEEPWGGYQARQSWRQKAGISDSANSYELYGLSLYVALNNIFGGSCEINPANYNEFFVQAAMLFTGSTVWAYVIGSACGIIATLDPAGIEFRQTLDELNLFVKEQSISNDLAIKLRSYFRNTIHLIRSKRYEVLLQKMSTRLRGDAAFRMCEFRMRAVPFLVHPDLEPEFMCNLAIKHKTMVYSRLERVPCTDLFIVERGVVAKRGRLGMVGECFGTDVILSNDNLRDIGDAIALTFVQTVSLTQKDIFELLPDYPQAYHIVRKAALRMALIRALVKAAQIVKRSQQKQTGMNIMDIFDKAMREAEDVVVARKREAEEAKAPISLSFKSLAGAASQLKMIEASKARKGGWGKIAGAAAKSLGGGGLAAVVSGGASSPPKRASAKIQLKNLLEKERERGPKTVEEQLVALSMRVDENHMAQKAQHQAVLGQLETVTQCLQQITTKLDAPRPLQKQRPPKQVVQRLKRSPASRRSEMEQQELQEAAPSGPSIEGPPRGLFEA